MVYISQELLPFPKISFHYAFLYQAVNNKNIVVNEKSSSDELIVQNRTRVVYEWKNNDGT